MLYQAKEFKLKLPDTEIDCISFGKGKTPLIMIQGLNTRGIKGASLPLALAYRIFARDYKVYLFDRRPSVRDVVTVKELAHDTASAMDALGLRDAMVLGVSQGGMIAEYLAIERPELVKKLVLAFTASRTNEKIEDSINTWVNFTKQKDMKALVTDMAERMYSEKYLKKYKI